MFINVGYQCGLEFVDYSLFLQVLFDLQVHYNANKTHVMYREYDECLND